MTTLIEKFWSRVFDRKQTAALFVADGDKKRVCHWRDAGFAVASIMAYLQKREVKKGDRVAILGWNTPEWVWADLAIQTFGAVTVPIYPNSSADQVNYVVNDSGAVLVLSNESAQLAKITGKGKVALFDQIMPELQPGLAHRPFLDWFMPDSSYRTQVEWSVLGPVMKPLRKQLGEPNFAGIADEDLATFIYTSGSSGAPKGCMITHGNITAALDSMSSVLALDASKDVYLSYLPLAHVYERINGMYMCIYNGVPVAFSSIEKIAENLPVFKPTMLCGVPAVWEKIYNGVLSPKAGLPKHLDKVGLWKPLLSYALSRKKGSASFAFFDRKFFSPVREKLGGKLRLLVSGGAPISAEILAFYNTLGLELLEGYGATETAGGIISNRPSWDKTRTGTKNKIGTVGLPAPGTELRIVIEKGEEAQGVGEIQMRSEQIFKGYWNLPTETAAAISEDGWFRSGDLGRVDAEGFLTISGRLNGMYKTSGGKYVSREKLEQALKPFPIVAYSVPVAHGRKYAVALIFVNQELAGSLVAGRSAPAGVDKAAWLAEQPEVTKAVDEALIGADIKLERWEQMKKVRIMPMAATMENGIITETLKIRSKVLIKRFEKEIDALYADGSSPPKSDGGTSGGSGKGIFSTFKGVFATIKSWVCYPWNALMDHIFGDLKYLT